MDVSPNLELASSRGHINVRLRQSELAAQRSFIEHEWYAGTPVPQIAGSLGVPIPDVIYFALRQGWPLRTSSGRPNCLGPREIDRIRVRWYRWIDVRAIAAEFFCDELSIRVLARCLRWRQRCIPMRLLDVRDEPTIRELWHAGWPVPQIAELFGLMSRDIQQLVVLRGWPFRTCQMPRLQLDPQQEADMRALWEAGVRVDQIGRRFGMGGQTVRRFAKQGGWPRLNQPRPRRVVQPPIRSARALVLEVRTEIRAMWDNRCPVPQIARRFGLSQSTVYRLAQVDGFPPRQIRQPVPPVDPETEARIEELWQSDLSLAEVGRRCGVLASAIRKLARLNDWPMRPPKSLPACLEPLPEAQVEELWQAGFPIRDIARRCNATFAQVHLLVRDKGWQVRGRRRIPGDILGPRACEMIELFLSNDVNAREVGDTFDVSRSYVAWIAQQYRDLR